jgi:hypothetical protein
MHIVDEAHSVPFVGQSTYDVGWAKLYSMLPSPEACLMRGQVVEITGFWTSVYNAGRASVGTNGFPKHVQWKSCNGLTPTAVLGTTVLWIKRGV